MALESFETRRFQAKTLALIDSANSIIGDETTNSLASSSKTDDGPG
jgi:hypothetical protein